MIFKPLERTDTVLYKGIAILMIVIHNFMHTFPSPKEMEFSFYDDRFNIFLESFNEPSNIVQILFSFLGHYGVQIFIFLSAYGLAKRYKNHLEINYFAYIKNRIKVIYPSFILALIFYVLVATNWSFGVLSPIKHLYWNMEIYFNKFVLIANFLPGQELSLSGPWWFISFIFQFYLVFPLLLKFYERWRGSSLLVLSVLSLAFNSYYQPTIGDINVYFTVLGHLPEFCLGIYFARQDKTEFSLSNVYFFIALIVFILGNIYAVFWPFTHLSFLVILVFIFNIMRDVIKSESMLRKVFLFFGAISMPLFLVNGFLREPFTSLAHGYNYWLTTLIFCLCSLCLSILAALIIAKLETIIMNRVNASSKGA